MPYHDSPSPAMRPSLAERSSSSQSVLRASPSGTVPSTSHKASTHKPSKAHAVGHNRMPHTRVPSYGKGLHKLTKIDANGGDGLVSTQSRSKVQKESTSPPLQQNFKRNSSTGALPRTKSKASVKKNTSELSLKRNGSAAQLGRAVRLDPTSRATRAFNGKPKKAKFSVGSEGQDDDQDEEEEEEEEEEAEWTEDTNSHSSPATTRTHTRQNSLGPNPSRPRTPPIVDGPTDRPYNNTSHQSAPTPPESPFQSSNKVPHHRQQGSHTAHAYPDADALTKRLLQRHSSHNLAPQMSSVSATAASTGTHSPHSMTQSQTEPSMPLDGISRFLSNGNSSSSSATPGSLTLSHHNHNRHHHTPQPSTSGPLPSDSFKPARRVKSTSHLSAPPYSTSPPHSSSTTRPASRSSQHQHPHYPSALDRKDPSQPSRTQLKSELQRQQSSVSNARPHAPIVQNGGGGGGGGAERKARAWESVGREMSNCKRYRNPLVEAVGRVRAKRGEMRRPRHLLADADADGDGGARRGREGEVEANGEGEEERLRGLLGRRGGGRGRVRFEVGGGERDGEEDAEDDAEGEGGADAERLRGLLRRLWRDGVVGAGG